MLINGININSFNAKQLTVDIQPGQIDNTNTWSRNFLTPFLNYAKTGFSTLELLLLVTGTNREDCLIKANNIIALCLKEKANVISLDGYTNNNFIGTLTSHKIEKSVRKEYYKLTLNFNGYLEGKETYTKEITTSGTIVNNSTTKTPCKITLTSTANVASATIKINSRKIIIKNITANSPIILNGMTGEFTENGANKFKDIDLWELPYLDAGNNTITCNKNYITVKLEYKNRFI